MFPDLDFTEAVANDKAILDQLKQAIQKAAMTATDPLQSPDAPKFNDDFSNYFVINNLPKTNEAKIAKLVSLI